RVQARTKGVEDVSEQQSVSSSVSSTRAAIANELTEAMRASLSVPKHKLSGEPRRQGTLPRTAGVADEACIGNNASQGLRGWTSDKTGKGSRRGGGGVIAQVGEGVTGFDAEPDTMQGTQGHAVRSDFKEGKMMLIISPTQSEAVVESEVVVPGVAYVASDNDNDENRPSESVYLDEGLEMNRRVKSTDVIEGKVEGKATPGSGERPTECIVFGQG
ncbi:unnamed protein product, partial [Choristocarpus tenellus]